MSMTAKQGKVVIDLFFKLLKTMYGSTHFIDNPAVQGDQTITIKHSDTNKTRHILSISVVVATDATAANRYLRLRRFTDNSPDRATSVVMCEVQVASNTWTYTFNVNLPDITENGVISHPVTQQMLLLRPGDSLVLDLISGVAGDAIDVLYEYMDFPKMG